jgi:hypothetical protein
MIAIVIFFRRPVELQAVEGVEPADDFLKRTRFGNVFGALYRRFTENAVAIPALQFPRHIAHSFDVGIACTGNARHRQFSLDNLQQAA